MQMKKYHQTKGQNDFSYIYLEAGNKLSLMISNTGKIKEETYYL
jgi:hypothetical protein